MCKGAAEKTEHVGIEVTGDLVSFEVVVTSLLVWARSNDPSHWSSYTAMRNSSALSSGCRWLAIASIAALAACGSEDDPVTPVDPAAPTAKDPSWFDRPNVSTARKPVVVYPERGTSAPLREILARSPQASQTPVRQLPELVPPVQNRRRRSAPAGAGSPVQTAAPVLNAPAPSLSFDGISNADNQAAVGFRVWPPDPNGDVGPNHYVQWVNLSLAVYDKTGNLLAGPSPGNTPWTGFAGPCGAQNDGDPLVIYDHLADRWVFTQFAITSAAGHQCFAVSTTSDPLGPYHLYDYAFSPGGGINDYPKIGLWPDAYYLTVNDFDGGGGFRAAVAAAVDREAMIDGLPAALVKFDVTAPNPGDFIFSLQPSHLEGRVLPPSGAPNYIINSFDDETWSGSPDPTTDSYNIWALHVDWTDPENLSQLIGPITLDAPEFDAEMCGFDRACIPQPAGGAGLDSLSQMTMYRLAYRNLGTHEALVLNHTVDVGGDRAGVRWTEIRDPSVLPVLHQTGTFAPDDGLNRWMGSVAMDGRGNIAIAYSVANGSVFPGLRYAARLADDPAGEMTQGEAVLVDGSTAQNSINRWGDYASLSVDELDDCTFWFTGEYASADNAGDWSTRIAAFQLPLCTATEIGFIEGIVTDDGGAPLAGARVSAGSFSVTTAANGSYRLSLVPGTYDVTAAAFGYLPVTQTGVEVVAETTATVDFALDPAPLARVEGWVYDGSDAGWPLYARLTFTAVGAPPVTVFTDPATGWYSVDLPAGTDFTSRVTALVPGYVAETRPVTAGPSGLTAHFGLEINGGTCEALGYAEGGTVFAEEGFEGAFPPAGWTVENTTSGCTGVPEWMAGPGANLTGAAGGFAEANSDQCGSSVAMSTTLTSPPIDLSGFAANEALSISFNQDLLTLPGTSARVEIWNGIDWVLVANQTTDARGPQRVTFGTDAANGVVDARVRFVYEAGWDWFWQIDDVELARKTCDYRFGGLVFGQVVDGNTGDGVVGATVSTGTEADVRTFATPQDPALGDGIYVTFLPRPQAVTASARNYVGVSSTVVPQVNGVVRTDLELAAGRIRIDPASIALRVPFGGQASATMTVYNDGGAPASVDFAEIEGRAVARPAGPFAPAGRRLGPKRLLDRDARGVRSIDPPPATPTLAAGEVGRRISTGLPGAWGLGFDSDTNTAWVGNISALGGADEMHEFATDGTPTGRVIDTSSYGNIFGADMAYDSNTGMVWQINVGGDDCIHEVDPVAGVVTGNTICPAFGTSERGLAFDPVTDTFYAGSWNDARVVQFDRSGAILRAVQTGLNISGLAYNPDTAHLFVLSNTDTADITVLDANDDLLPIGEFDFTDGGAPAFADFSQAGLELDCNGDLWAMDQTNGTIVVGASGEARTCVADLDWLIVNPQSVTVAPGSSVVVTVTVDASNLTPGLYEAHLLPKTDTPYDVPAVPVAAEVRFLDVPEGSYGDDEIHGLAGADITYGCGGGNFCPRALLTRRVYAVWGLRSALGADYVPPRARGLMFVDVSPDSFGADFVEDAAARGYMMPCSDGLFCADSAVTRGEAAITILRLVEGPAYEPPAATGVFGDVAPNLAPWAEDVWSRGIIESCAPGSFCPNAATIRADHAIWLVRAFGFPTFGL